MHKKLFALVFTVLIVFSSFSGFTVEPVAECKHVLTGDILVENIHPHKEYMTCTLCKVKVYTGNNRTRPHGNGTNGTCIQCGTHTYTGRTCVSKGVCVCGATISASGHTLASTQYSDAAHPHAYFKYCILCDAKVYTTGNAVKNHGDGAWGSGTCPDCGSHTYVGQTCTTAGVCVCGDTIPMLGHTLEGVRYSDAAHPHNYFEYCRVCWDKVYTGGSATKNHGDGTIGSGTCPYCGDHTYRPVSSVSEHPHLTTIACACGDIIERYTIDESCSSCAVFRKTVTNEGKGSCKFSMLVTAEGLPVPLILVLDGTVTYTNMYMEPPQDSPMYEGITPFISYYSTVNSTAICSSTVETLRYYAASHPSVRYYNSSGDLLATQTLNLTTDHNTYGNTFILDEKPAYAITGAGFMLNDVILVLGDPEFEVVVYFP